MIVLLQLPKANSVYLSNPNNNNAKYVLFSLKYTDKIFSQTSLLIKKSNTMIIHFFSVFFVFSIMLRPLSRSISVCVSFIELCR